MVEFGKAVELHYSHGPPRFLHTIPRVPPRHMPLEKRLKGEAGVRSCVGAGGVGKTTILGGAGAWAGDAWQEGCSREHRPRQADLRERWACASSPGEPHRIEPRTLAEHRRSMRAASCGR